MANIHVVDESNFGAEVLETSEPVLVDFWGEGCAPCRMLQPVLEKLAQRYAGQLKVVKCDVFANQDLAVRYGIMGMPTLLFFRDGQVVDQVVGYRNEAQLAAKIEEILPVSVG